ncbi:MAG: aromatic ring-hydroxylating dioxygenase subunit alpha [Marinicaulis sp.]|nr:aromatic ring-hydroxylating dioxygenase subunit alpha [Marinicaulis sp.]NNE42399.1 aromatic ring-hydroxylating dioxygenase subunit alpha [Marinicaulis sp.]NNL87530.1 aromatic ring-hydroxylating dioxygenase subunit alpha [Marinicaulis sp.]
MKRSPNILNDTPDNLRAQLKRQMDQQGRAMNSYFYRSPLVYELELHNLVFKSWIYAAHITELPNPGDFVLLEVGEESLIIVRDRNNEIHALINICRHRGARVCEKLKGHSKTFVCPYHGWTYSLDGTLRSARHMEMRKDFNRADFPLKRAKVLVHMGLIFVNLDEQAADLSGPLSKIDVQLGAYDLKNAKVAHKQIYKVDANWKYCLENYLECYHCKTAHPHYARIHTLADLDEDAKDFDAAMRARASVETGVAGIEKEYRKIYSAAEAFGACVQATRYGLYDGYLTGSEDGQAVGPLMGKMKGYDGGASDFQFGPLTFMLSYPDHCVLYRFIPRGQNKTDMEVVWFVNGDAVEGENYEINRLTWLWDQTTLEDKYIISRNSEGASSDFFEPGPLHPEFEQTLMMFIDWYLDVMQSVIK